MMVQLPVYISQSPVIPVPHIHLGVLRWLSLKQIWNDKYVKASINAL